MSDILSKLEKLTPEELAKIADLISSFKGEKEEQEEQEEISDPEEDLQDLEDTQLEHKEQEDQQDLTVEEIEQEELEARRSAGRGRRSSRNQVSSDGGGRRGRTGPRSGQESFNHSSRSGSRGAAARSETVVLSKENKFERMSERKSFKKDSEIDKKLWGRNEVTERPDKFEYLDVQCNGPCGMWYDVHPKLVYVDPETHKYKYTCDICSPRGGNDGN